MKTLTLTILAGALLAVGCKKKEDATPATDNSKAKLTVTKNVDQTFKVDIHYTEKNTDTYLEDIMKIYVNDTFFANTTVDPKPINSDFTHTTVRKYLGGTYKVFLVRGVITSGSYIRDTIATVSGN
ncbi:MAG: hypothetical protein V4649_04735 [Bacteroidota bacterium]